MNPSSEQYDMVLNSREALLTYCETLPWKDLTASPELFNGGCIRDLLVHEANVYRFWLAQIALNKTLPFFENDPVTGMNAVRSLFSETDTLVQEFMDHFKDQWTAPLPWSIPNRNVTVEASPFKIFTHVITHEFHHKGQILSMSRRLGHIPPDTDIIRF